MADYPSAPPACFSCQDSNYGCPQCNRTPRPGYPSTERFPPRPPQYNPPQGPHYPPQGPHYPSSHPNYPPSGPQYPPSRPEYPPQNPPSWPHQPQPPSRPYYPPSQPGRPGYPPQRPSNVRPPPGGRPQNGPAYYWVDTVARGGVPSTALRGGTDIDGQEIYVGRAFHEGDWLPAKIVPGRGQAYVAYNGLEHCVDNFQVLCEQRFDWVPASRGHIPPGAVEGGKTVDGENLYIGRAHHEGSVTIGKIHPSHGTCYIPFGGREIGYADYEILVLRS